MSDTVKSSSPTAANAAKLGGGPIRATRSYGLRPSPSTPLLPGSDSRKWWYASTTSAWWTSERSATEPMSTEISKGGKRASSTRSPPTAVMRRSASFDAITTGYLSGRWPCRDPVSSMASLVARPIVLTIDKSTQTPFDWDEVDGCVSCADVSKQQRTPLHRRCPSLTGIVKEGRTSSNKNKDGAVHSSVRGSPVLLSSGSAGSRAIAIPNLTRRNPLIPCQGSAEGFNQEIERLVRNTSAAEGDRDVSKIPTPDGHRAPIADQLLRVRSIDTQTPSGTFPPSAADRHFPRVLGAAGNDDSPLSTLPIIPGGDDVDDDTSELEHEDGRSDVEPTPVEDTMSPLFVYFIENSCQRLPPDGCEQRIDAKVATSEHWRGVFSDPIVDRPLPAIVKCHIPSERSAFCPLLKNYVSHQLALSAATVVGGGVSTIEAQ